MDAKQDEIESLVAKLIEEMGPIAQLPKKEGMLAPDGESWLVPEKNEAGFRDIILRSRGRSRNFTAVFLEEFVTYSSTAQLNIELRLPKLVACFKTSLKLNFNHKEYNSESIDVGSM